MRIGNAKNGMHQRHMAAFYAAHCPDDSPLFVAAWYSLAVALVAAVGAATGRLTLRW